ncbi:hypothetical protein [Curtobacterium sp. Leaf261]|uniref:hypothetical protein n=1 Tax=Curtobacterium sp. Leaf261 TaxID=1736311 RepID=UPI000700E793|nr:hypothetical protein [Curtobacterium sp. Leaf261]KQO65025.1 hypothetical protein ASF23_02475 [Curtobacterium sp. Leaf261]
MLPRTLRWAYVVPILVAQLFAFFTMFETDQDRFIGPTSIIKVSETADSAPAADVTAMVRRVSRETGAGIAREVTDASDPNRHRTLVVTASDTTSLPGRWTVDGYRDFDPSMRTSVVAMDESNSADPRGYYYTFAGHGSEGVFVDGFRSLGYEVRAAPYETILDMSLWTVGGSGLAAAGSLVLLVVVLAAGGCLGAPRRGALRRMSGASAVAVCLREAWDVTRRAAPWFATLIVGAALLGVYNGLAQHTTYLLVFGVLWVVFTVPVVLTHVICTLVLRRQQIASAIRGNRPARSSIALAGASRVVATLILVPSVFASVQSTAATASIQAARADRAAAGTAAQLWGSGSLGAPSRRDAFWDRLGRFARDAQSRREAFLVHGDELSVADRPDLGALPVLVVDRGYLERQTVRGADGARVEVPPGGQIGGVPEVMIPERLRAEASAVTDAVRDQVLRDPRGGPAPDVRTGLIKDAQRLYTYSTDQIRMPSWVVDPVVVVEPPGSATFSDDTYGSWITSGEVLFTDTDVAATAIARHHLDRVFLAVFPVAREAADEEHRLTAARRVALLSGIGAIAVAVFAAAGTVGLVRRRQATENFARFASGWSYARANRALLALECAVFLLGTLACANAFWSARTSVRGPLQALDPSAASAPAALSGSMAAVCFVSAVSIGVGLVSSARSIRSRSSES